MGIYGIMNTSVSGMNAQANKLSTVADNIANVNTTGYKSVSTSFSSMVINSGGSSYDSGSVRTAISQSVSKKGPMQFTTSGTDLAVNGQGFFIVASPQGGQYLTRAGDFVQNAQGDLVNSGGFTLQGYPITAGATGTTLQGVNVSNMQMEAQATTSARVNMNFPDGTPLNDVKQTSVTMYDGLGNEHKITFEFTKSAKGAPPVSPGTAATATSWDVTVTGADVTGTPQLKFDGATGEVKTGGTFDITVAGKKISVDMTSSTNLAAGFSPQEVVVDGSAPSSVEKVRMDETGTLFAIYGNGAERSVFKVPLGNVVSPDKLTLRSGNVYAVNNDAGALRIGTAGTAGFGTMRSGALEGSNVDLASELTSMIQSQRSYSANAKAFTASSEILQELVNLR
ncbi:flagellar hook protein FlgE [Polycladidibacter hongkongensis]|uniref:flagellar hook protein FlgE n=1 Tax=Polycladidibacter hongkongensis TaxID=1647556 RepID=UPI00082E62E0|nr:flagellar hook protein FlgE [Pseudovibrio hongkongensis]